MRDKEQEWNQSDADHDAELAEMQDKIEREGKPDSEAKPHPEYGPCDAIANGQCAECIRQGYEVERVQPEPELNGLDKNGINPRITAKIERDDFLLQAAKVANADGQRGLLGGSVQPEPAKPCRHCANGDHDNCELDCENRVECGCDCKGEPVPSTSVEPQVEPSEEDLIADAFAKAAANCHGGTIQTKIVDWTPTHENCDECNKLAPTLDVVLACDYDTLRSRLAEVEKERDALRDERDEYQLTYELMADASRRAVADWRKQDPQGRRLMLPDLKEHILWAFREREAAESALAKMQWVSVEERLPDNQDYSDSFVPLYIVLDKDGYALAERYDNEWWGEFGVIREVTHWRPLPDPPGSALGRDKGMEGK